MWYNAFIPVSHLGDVRSRSTSDLGRLHLKGNDVKDTKEFFAALSVSERERFLLLSVVLREQDVIRAAENAATEKLTAYNDYALYSHNPHNPPICNGDLDWPGGPFDSIGS